MADPKDVDKGGDILWIFGFIGLICLVIWYFFGIQIAKFYLTIKLQEAKFISFFLPFEELKAYIEAIKTNAITNWNFKSMLSVGNRIGLYFNAIFALPVGFFAYKLWNANPIERYKRIFSMQSLKESEQAVWPYIAPVVNIDLMAEDFFKGPYAMAMQPYAFAIKYGLLADEKNITSLDRKRTEKLFITQLGKPFMGFDKLNQQERAMVAVLAAHGLGDKNGAMNAVNKMAVSSAQCGIKKMPDFSSTQPLLKHIEDPRVQEVFSKHAYVYTVIAAMVEFSRITGVFPSSYFVWLKPRDRTLWYVINFVGRKTSFAETAGIVGHLKAEIVAEHKLDTPFVAKAIDGLAKALSEVKLK